MIDGKTAVKIATEYLYKMYGKGKLLNPMLEEIELSDDDKYWIVTLGFDRPKYAPGDYRDILVGPSYQRVYKVVKVDAEKGRPKSMKMREL